MATKKILIVEDDMFVREIYSTKFLNEGFLVMLAENGVEAMEKIERELPDLILLDIIMPHMDGMETLRRIRQNERLSDIPVIMLTNIAEQGSMQQGTMLGISGYLIKSHFLPQEVVEKVNMILER